MGPGRAVEMMGPGRAVDMGPGRAVEMGPGRAVELGPGRAVVVATVTTAATVARLALLLGGGLRWLELSRRLSLSRRAGGQGHMVDLNKIPRPRAVPYSPKS